MGKKILFNQDDAGKIQDYLKTNGIPVKSVTAGGGHIEVELEDTATTTDEKKLKNVMEAMGWL